MILGPNGPFTNLPPTIETQVEWIADADLATSRPPRPAGSTSSPTRRPTGPTTCARDRRTRPCSRKADSWIFGANIPGKKRSVMFYLGGLGEYRKIVAAEKTAGYPSFTLRTPPLPVGASRMRRPSRPLQGASQN